ncbi:MULTISPECIES: GIY-YIG nuclease family protein [Xanthomonas]|uniref:GIY-YIG nuclease family protein n=1 Tax=Xanthomonas dyei TaxID=743699 RepID=A0ABZ0DC61_9XANT|nr:GIY-YIG nuclease family protein [Xanthomonas dyei]WOB27774.1 GIY-YIG nuclease family protein [Xanthomonas dyei]WOB55396.1 GIY-YIG nuclease family protein [Xanthomonas dyei]
MSWKRNQKHLPRPRHLYGLFFNNGCCYVGQTVDLKQREQQHRSPRGAWQGKSFSFVPLSVMTGTQADAELHEYAWRYKAFQKGWRIYAKPPGILIRNPRRRTSWAMKGLAASYTWPGNVPGRAPSVVTTSASGVRLLKPALTWLFLYPMFLMLVVLASRSTL